MILKNKNFFYRLLWLIILAILTTIVTLIIENISNVLSYILIIILSIIIFFSVILEIKRNKKVDLTNPLYLFAVFYSLIYIVRPLVVITDPERIEFLSRGFLEDIETYINYMMVYALFGAFMFLFGFKIGKKSYEVRTETSHFEIDWSITCFSLIIIVYFLIGIISYFIFVHTLGGLWTIIRGIGGSFLEEASGKYFLAAGTGFVHAATLLFVGISAFKKKLTVLALLSLIISTGLAATFGQRGLILVIWMTTLYIFYIARGWERNNIIILTILGVLAYFFVGLGYIRFHTIDDRSWEQICRSIIQFIQGSPHLFIRELTNEFSEFDFSSILVARMPEILAYQYGKTFFDLILIPIPRIIWPDKPIPIDFLITQLLYPEYGWGRPIGLLGELYTNFHIFGILIGMFLFGLGWGTLFKYFKKNKENVGVIISYVFILSHIPLLLTRSFAFMLGGILQILIPLLIAFWFLKRSHFSKAKVCLFTFISKEQ